MLGTDHVDLSDAELVQLSLRGAQVRQADLSNLRVRDALLVGADLSGVIDGLKVNGIEVAPLIWAEMVRLDPPLGLIRSEQLDELRSAWDVAVARWHDTIEQVRGMAPEVSGTRVDGEWSVNETLRHLVFVVDAWVGRTVRGEAEPYHRLGLPPSFLPDLGHLGIDAAATPAFAEAVMVFESRCDTVVALLAELGQDDLAVACAANAAPGFPPSTEVSIGRCVRTVVGEFFGHHRYVERDLAAIGQH